MQRSALCRSRRELSNAYFLAKFGLDTAENEPCQVCPTEQCKGRLRETALSTPGPGRRAAQRPAPGRPVRAAAVDLPRRTGHADLRGDAQAFSISARDRRAAAAEDGKREEPKRPGTPWLIPQSVAAGRPAVAARGVAGAGRVAAAAHGPATQAADG